MEDSDGSRLHDPDVEEPGRHRPADGDGFEKYAQLEGADLGRASPARMYDYLLGGAHNFAVDRELARQAIVDSPGMVTAVWAFRHFLRRTVRACVEQGIDQFLDLGSGLPTVGTVHEVARALNATARVAYIDHEPVAVAHSRRILDGVDGVSVCHGDLTDPAAVLADPAVRRTVDFTRPVAVLMLAVLHFLPDTDQVHRIVKAYRRPLVPGSALVISHGSADYDDPVLASAVRAGQQVYARSAQPTHLRDRRQLAALFTGMDLAPPGLVDIAHWRPDPATTDPHQIAPVGAYGALATAPHPDQQ